MASHKITTSQISGFLGNVDLQNGYTHRRPEEIERSNYNTMFQTTSARKLTKDFSNFLHYVEKIDFEGGLR